MSPIIEAILALPVPAPHRFVVGEEATYRLGPRGHARIVVVLRVDETLSGLYYLVTWLSTRAGETRRCETHLPAEMLEESPCTPSTRG